MVEECKRETKWNNTFESQKKTNISTITVEILKQANEFTEAPIVGVDEAGRGAVIGPLVIAGVCIDESKFHYLKNIGVKDSKLLSREKREELFNKILDVANIVCIVKLPPKIIDLWVYAHKLNELEALAAAKILNKLYPFKLAIIDAPSTPQSYKQYLQKWTSNIPSIKLLVESKADKKYIIVAAASIIAKVMRDREIKRISRELNIDLGSGYPSDPRTRAALEKLISKYPDIIRHSWKTVRSLFQHQLTEWLLEKS